MNDIDINDWLTFVCIVDEQGFTAAAKKLGLSPSVLSKRISRLEATLKARLLQRSTRQLVLTEIGQEFYERCLRIQSEIEETVLSVSKTHAKPQGKLRMSAPMSFGHQHLIPAITDFMNLYPDIQIELVLGSYFPNLIEGNLDLAIHVKDLVDSSLFARQIGSRCTRVYASPDYFARHGIPKTPEDLRAHNCLLYQLQPEKHEWRFYRQGKELLIPVSGNFKANSIQALAKAAIAGLGIVKLPGYMATHELVAGKLQSVLTQYCPKDIGIYAVYSHKQHLAPKIKVFVDYLAERFTSVQHWNE